MKTIHMLQVVLLSAYVLTGCAKMPEKLISPTVKVEAQIIDNQEMYLLTFSSGLQNENSDIAFLDMKGDVVIHGGGKSDEAIMTLPFEIPIILPFDTGVIDLEKQFSEREIIPLAVLLGSDREKLINDGGIEGSYIEEKNVKLDIRSCQKKKILELLKEKINEKD